jgi:hypothetical protein
MEPVQVTGIGVLLILAHLGAFQMNAGCSLNCREVGP